MRLRSRLVLAIALVVPCALPAQEAPPSPRPESPAFPSEVELVNVDVVVVDGKGLAVPGLAAADFKILEDGVPQAVTRFEAVRLPEAAPADRGSRRPVYSSNQTPEARQHRTFVIVFDDIHLTPLQAQRGKAAVAHFLKTGTREGDRVTLVATGGGAWWYERMPEGRESLMAILKRLDGRYIPLSTPDRVTDWEAMRIMAYDDPDVAYQVQRRFDAYGTVGRERVANREYADATRTTAAVGLIDPYVRARAQDTYNAATTRRKITLGVMARALYSLAEMRGRKAMVLVSQGFIHEPDFKDMKDVVDASLRVNVPVYFIDTRGLQAMPDYMTAAFLQPFDVQDTVAILADLTRDAEGSEGLALDTGGFAIRNTNDLESGLLRVSSESQTYYLLGYAPSNTARDGKFRRIEVRLTGSGKGRKVRARRGYYAPRDGAPAETKSKADLEIARALDSPFEKRDVGLRVGALAFDEALQGKATVMVNAEIDTRELSLREEDGRARGEIAFLLEAQHRESGEIFRFDEKIEMAMLPETRDQVARSGYTVSRELTLPKGGYQAKVVVRDLGSGRLGSVIHDFEVPDPASFRLTSPILADTLETRPPGDTRPPRPVLRVRRSFAPGSTLYVQYSVLGAAKNEATRMPQVLGAYEIRRLDGSLLKGAPPTRINPTSLGALIRLHGINLATAEPGDYELVLVVRDEVASRSLEVREPFVVEVRGPDAADRAR
jgi:VWFA-related protein